jgi:hypothetical protein
MFNVMTNMMDKHELRHLMNKFKFPEDNMQELEAKYHGNANLKDRIYNAMLFWREFSGKDATVDELIRITHIVGFENVSEKLYAMKIYSQAVRL